MSFSIIINVDGVARAATKLRSLGELDSGQFLVELGGHVENQTRRRIQEEKTAPDGSPWKPNAEGTSILFREGYLGDSIAWLVTGNQVEVGSDRPYAGIHQYGGEIVPKNKNMLQFRVAGRFVTTDKVTMPARPYLGISAENAAEIEEFATDFIARHLG